MNSHGQVGGGGGGRWVEYAALKSLDFFFPPPLLPRFLN